MKNAKHILSTMLHVIYLAHGQYSKNVNSYDLALLILSAALYLRIGKKISIPFV